MLIFLVITFSLTYLVEYWLYLAGGLKTWFALPVLIGVMFIPTVSAVLTVKLVEKGSLKGYGVRVGVKKYYVYGYFLPLLFVCFSLSLVWLFRTASLTLKGFKELIEMAPVPEEYKGVVIPLIVFEMAIAPFINAIPAFGEEYGWRGYLLTEFLRYGLLKAILATGVIWGVWHAPLILMGYNYPHHPDIVGVLFFTVWCVLWGVLLAWLRIKSGSVFPATLCHGAINAHVGLGMLIAPSEDELYTAPFGWPALVALAVMAFAAYASLVRGEHRQGVS